MSLEQHPAQEQQSPSLEPSDLGQTEDLWHEPVPQQHHRQAHDCSREDHVHDDVNDDSKKFHAGSLVAVDVSIIGPLGPYVNYFSASASALSLEIWAACSSFSSAVLCFQKIVSCPRLYSQVSQISNTDIKIQNPNQPDITMLVPLVSKFIGLVPTTNVNIHIPTHVEVVSLDVAAIVIAFVHCRQQLLQECQRIAVEVLVIPVRVHVNALRCRLKGQVCRARLCSTHTIETANEVDAALLDVDDQRTVTPNSNGCLDAVLLADRFDSGCKLCLLLLTHVCHFALLCVLQCLNYNGSLRTRQPLLEPVNHALLSELADHAFFEPQALHSAQPRAIGNAVDAIDLDADPQLAIRHVEPFCTIDQHEFQLDDLCTEFLPIRPKALIALVPQESVDSCSLLVGSSFGGQCVSVHHFLLCVNDSSILWP